MRSARKEVKKENIVTFLEICEGNTKRNVNDITKLVYLRRKYEILNEKGMAYNLLSNILHKRDEPIIPSDMNQKMTQEEIEEGTKQIKEESNIDFDYSRMLKSVKDDEHLKRLYKETDIENVIAGFNMLTEKEVGHQRVKVCYAHVSSAKQKEDLVRQVDLLHKEYPPGT